MFTCILGIPEELAPEPVVISCSASTFLEIKGGLDFRMIFD